MKTLYTSVLAVLAAVVLVGSIGASLQQHASAIIINNGKEFKKLTNEFEKAVLDAAAMDDTAEITRLTDQYHDDVIELFRQ